MTDQQVEKMQSAANLNTVFLAIISGGISILATASVMIWQGQKEMSKEFSELKGGMAVSIPSIEKRLDNLETKVYASPTPSR